MLRCAATVEGRAEVSEGAAAILCAVSVRRGHACLCSRLSGMDGVHPVAFPPIPQLGIRSRWTEPALSAPPPHGRAEFRGPGDFVYPLCRHPRPGGPAG